MEYAAIQELIFYFLGLPNFPSATLAKGSGNVGRSPFLRRGLFLGIPGQCCPQGQDHGWRGDSVSSCAPLFVFSTNSELKAELSQVPVPGRSQCFIFIVFISQFYSFEGQVLISFPFIVMSKVDFKMKLFIQNELLKEKY